jgi:diguanylate cyclase (GGDEF)-like protein
VSGARLVPRARSRVASLLADDRAHPGKLMARLHQLRAVEDGPVFSAALSLLAHLEVPEAEGEEILGRIVLHRGALTRLLSRDPGMSVAAVDYLTNVDRRLVQPMVVEADELEQTRRSAWTDALTGLPNRRYLDVAIEREVRRSRRFGLQFCVLMLDLDGFKGINDRLGHLVGDLVLQKVADLVRHTARDSDVAARYGGDEMALVLPDTGVEGSLALAERLRREVEREFASPFVGHALAMTMTGGIALYPTDAQEPGNLLGCADRALYAAKREGGNRVRAHVAERRAWGRHPMPSRPQVTLSTSSGPAAARAVDLSRGGLLVEMEDAPAPRSPVRVALLPGGSEGGGYDVAGRVVWRSPATSAGPDRAGIAFDLALPESVLRDRLAAVASS